MAYTINIEHISADNRSVSLTRTAGGKTETRAFQKSHVRYETVIDEDAKTVTDIPHESVNEDFESQVDAWTGITGYAAANLGGLV